MNITKFYCFIIAVIKFNPFYPGCRKHCEPCESISSLIKKKFETFDQAILLLIKYCTCRPIAMTC